MFQQHVVTVLDSEVAGNIIVTGTKKVAAFDLKLEWLTISASLFLPILYAVSVIWGKLG